MANPVIINNDSGKLEVFNPIFTDLEIEAGEALDMDAGSVLAFDATTGTWIWTDSATASVANAKAVLVQDISFSEAGTRENTRCLIGGEVDQDKLIFQGSDTVDTIPAGGEDTFGLQLRSYGIVTRKGQVIDELDNQP